MVSTALRDIMVERLSTLGLTAWQMASVAEYLQGNCNSPASAKRLTSNLSGRVGADSSDLAVKCLIRAGVVVDTDNGYILDPRLTSRANKGKKVPAMESSFAVSAASTTASASFRGGSPIKASADRALAEERLDAWSRSRRARRACLTPLTPRELSYEIWGDEKMLDVAAGVLESAKPDFCPVFSPAFMDCDRGSVLVIENLDPYLTLCDALMQTRIGRLLGMPISAVVYRGGSGFASPACLRDWLSGTRLAGRPVLYWGDIDRAGVHDLNRFSSCEGLGARPFNRMYAKMVSKQARRFRQGMPPARASAGQTFGVGDVYSLDAFPSELKEAVVPILGHGCRIPQEILTFTDYLTFIGWAPAVRWLLLGASSRGDEERDSDE